MGVPTETMSAPTDFCSETMESKCWTEANCCVRVPDYEVKASKCRTGEFFFIPNFLVIGDVKFTLKVFPNGTNKHSAGNQCVFLSVDCHQTIICSVSLSIGSADTPFCPSAFVSSKVFVPRAKTVNGASKEQRFVLDGVQKNYVPADHLDGGLLCFDVHVRFIAKDQDQHVEIPKQGLDWQPKQLTSGVSQVKDSSKATLHFWGKEYHL